VSIEVKREIGPVLFIDIVSYSKLLPHDAGVTELLYSPFLRAYKDDPGFIAFAQNVGVDAERQSIVERTVAGSL